MNADPNAMPDELLPQCAQSGSALHTNSHLGDVVQQIIATLLLRDGHPDLHSVATILGLGVRTLQRRLSEERLTYACVVARARFNLAQRLLDDPAYKIIEVALDLGYSDQAHFDRAFVRWTGLTPREFRQRRATAYSDNRHSVTSSRCEFLRSEAVTTRQR